jgi:hypothetical protein
MGMTGARFTALQPAQSYPSLSISEKRSEKLERGYLPIPAYFPRRRADNERNGSPPTQDNGILFLRALCVFEHVDVGAGGPKGH